LLMQAAPLETTPHADQLPEPVKLARAQFRLIVAQYARHDTLSEQSSGLMYRLSMVFAGARFTRGRGETPVLRDTFKPVPFASLDAPGSGLPDEAEQTLTRYFDVKLSSLHFAGPAFYNNTLVDGFGHLAMVYPVTLYVARWIALSNDRPAVTTPDVQQALSIVDHPHGYSPAMGLGNFRRRVKWLVDNDHLSHLIGWYGRGGVTTCST